ncbi:class I SAM-dependent methyltransferase [Microbacterium esteraromaticum]|uniref:Class I SAM-dependent methyltransferase n=1 Tax=Microbacterium esteraromaticum TaxID=57043 RepID=A0A7D8ADB1_9MICO|nr:class I SAM-dependent methyltransferase [Microbacterium esteraromaticum]QMU97624.1 class I SAM-dependent methyltransferase [Microbacterium esteraromaticum]
MSDSRATSFGAEADNYEAARPDYPFEAVAWMLDRLPSGARRLVDVGAGTGKLTRVVAEAKDAEVVAVDPDAAMLAKLREAVPGVPTFVGTAESLPLPDASVDAVVLGQAWHWVDPVAASAEIGRAVRPGGTLGLIWNARDNRVDWVRRLTAVMNASAAEEMLDAGGPTVASPFGELESERWEWVRPMTREQLHRMAASRSHLITASEGERGEIRRQMDELFDELGLHGDGTVDVPYVTSAFRSLRAG